MAYSLNRIKGACYDFTIAKTDMEKTIIKKIILAVGAILIVAGLLAYLLSSLEGVVIPADFTVARQKAAIVSQDIVNITNETGKSIELANRAESEGDLQRILGLIEEAKNRIRSPIRKLSNFPNPSSRWRNRSRASNP